MVQHLPTLPPALLERCLALSEQLYAMKSGAAKLEISPSHFVFSVNQYPGTKETGSTFSSSNTLKRKKTPSDLRRNAARKAQFLIKKNLAKSSSSTSPVNQPASAEEPLDPTKPSTTTPPTTTQNPVEISPGDSSETPKESPSSNEIPGNNTSETEVHIEVDQHHPVIFPIASPAQPNSTDQEKKHPKEVNLNSEDEKKSETSNEASIPTDELHKKKQLTELHLLMCSADQAASYKFGNKFKISSFLGQPHPRNKHHFLYAIHLDDTNVNQMKTALNDCNEKKNLIKIYIPSENKNYFPDKQNHCQECINHYVRK